MYLLRPRFALGVLCFAATLPVTGAYAQQEPAALEEVTVTARRVEENIMTVPMSVSTMSSAELEANNVKDMAELSLFEPSFRFVNQLGGQSSLNDRSQFGVSFRGLYEGQGTGVESTGSGSVFIDGAPVIDAMPPSLDEVQRVEVLKGPQSVYFGRSTFAGAINYITKDPSLTTFGGSVSGEASSFNSTDDYLAVDIPLINDVLGTRISLRHTIKGGDYTNASDTDQKLGEEGTDTASITVLFKPTDQLKAKLWFNWFEFDDGPPAQLGINPGDVYPGTNTSVFNMASPAGAAYQGGYIRGQTPYVSQLSTSTISGNYTMTPFLQQVGVNNNFPGYTAALAFDPSYEDFMGLRRTAYQSDFKVDYEVMPGYFLSWLSAGHWNKDEGHFDTDNRDGENYCNGATCAQVPNTPGLGLASLLGLTPAQTTAAGILPYYSFNLSEEQMHEDWSTEIRFTSPQDRAFKYTAGVSYLHSLTPGLDLYGETPYGPSQLSGPALTITKTPAVFAGVYYEFVPKLTLGIEARYQWDELYNHIQYSGNQVNTGPSAVPLSVTYKSFSPRVTLDYQFQPDSTAYILFSRGYRPGGFNSENALYNAAQLAYVASQGASTSISYGQERLDNYEFGVKSTFLDGRARATVAFYYDRWINGQVGSVLSVPSFGNVDLPDATQDSPVSNSGLILLKGIEWTGDIQATDKILVNTAFALNDTDVQDYSPCSDCLHILGTDAAHGVVPQVPKWTATIAATYTDKLFDDWKWYGRGEFNYSGIKYVDWANVAYSPPADLLNLHLGMRNEKIQIEAWVKNLLNNSAPLGTDPQVDPFTFFGVNKNTIDYALPDKRWFGLRVNYKF
jgi:iron complex outermembrane receptor protein